MRPATLRAAGADGAGSLSGRAASVAASGQGREAQRTGRGGLRRSTYRCNGRSKGERLNLRLVVSSSPQGR